MGSLARTVLSAAGICVAAAALVPSGAAAFGTVNILGQRAEHERATILALYCRVGQPHDGACFESASLRNVAGSAGTFGAVGAPDNLPLHLTGGPAYWHCDEGDFLHTPGYPQSRARATEILDSCRKWGRDMLYDGRSDSTFGRTWPTQGAVATATQLLNSRGNVDVSDPGTGIFKPSCTFNGKKGRAKCNVWEPWGYVLHVTEDFYSHSNWADQSNPDKPIGVTNPPGIARRDLPSYWDLRQPTAALPDSRLATGCYPTAKCANRITHDEGLNKDKEYINLATGVVSDPKTPRGQILDNAQRAVNGAVGEARRQWAIFRDALVARYGLERGGKMICALTSDRANKSCNDAGRARSVFASIPTSYVMFASVLNGRMCLDDPGASTTDGTRIQMFECNGHAAQQFQVTGREVQFTSTGASPAVRVVGKCLDVPGANSADGTRVQISTCNGSPAQRVTITASGELKMLGKCLDIEGASQSPGAAVILFPCKTSSNQLWQVR